ncbi:MAG: helix-turn-helix transcriptional regulator [Opitutaceae bacterium]
MGDPADAQPIWATFVDLPQGAKPLLHALIADSGIGVLLEKLSPNHWPQHDHAQWQVAILFGRAECVAHWHASDGIEIERTLRGGAVWIVPPGCQHWIDWTVEGEVIVVYVHPMRVREMASQLRSATVGSLSDYVATEPLLAELCRDLLQFCQRPVLASATRIANTASLLAVIVMETEFSLAGQPAEGPLGSAAKVVEWVKKHVSTALREELSVAKLAKEIGISPRHFRRLFRRATGMTPQEYLWSRRVAHGKALLLGGRHNVTEAAAEAGFADQAHMNRHFRATFGVSPSAFLPRRRPHGSQ